MWHVARATTAAPLYFEPLKLTPDDNTRRLGTDLQSIGRARQSSTKRQLRINMSIGTFVSIGTARPKPQPTGSRFSQVIRGGINRLGDPGRHRRSCATPASQTVILHAYLLDTYYLSRGIITNPS